MIGLGWMELLIFALLFLVPLMIVIRVLLRNRRKEKPPEDDAGW